MSALHDYVEVLPRLAPRRQARLRVVPQTQPGPPLVRLVVAVVVLGVVGLVTVLVLHTLLAQDSYRLHDAQKTAAALQAQEEALARQVEGLNDPASIAAKAAALGMVPGDSPIFLMPNGKTLGASLPKGSHISYPSTPPASGLVVVGTRSAPAAKPTVANTDATKAPAK